MPSRLELALADRYAIERELGEGGMAVVYLAQDLRHHRKVAVKVLRPELAAVIGAERFLAEIRTTANLQHPHILPLFDSGIAGRNEESEPAHPATLATLAAPATFLYYVLPYVEGENLRDRLTREKQLPIPDVVRIAKEVASALDYAHRHGVIHRDIKPENIMLHDGQALVADFGIALAASKAGTNSRMTETGMSLGTPHYMSPEQAMGEREVTARSDIYALGAITYEMLVGEPPFTGPTVQAIVPKVLTEEPRPLLPKRHTIPPHIQTVVMTALEKLAADRFASAAEFAAALENPALTRTAPLVTAPARRFGGRVIDRLALPLAAATVGLAALVLWLFFRPGPSLPVTRYSLALPATQTPNPLGRAVLSPDGSRLVYLGPPADRPQLWMKPRDRAGATPIAGTTGAGSFAVSPDGESVAFVLGSQVRRVPLAGGASTVLGDSASQLWPGIAWIDDEIVYVHLAGRGLRTVSSAGGASRRIYQPDSAVSILPVGLPGGRFILFTRCRGGVCGLEQDLWASDVRTGAARRLLPGVAGAQYSETGHLVYVGRDGVMMAAPFDPRTATLKGEGVPVLDSIVVSQGILPLFSLSQSGDLVIRQGPPAEAAEYDMVFIDRTGRETLIDSTWPVRHTVSGANAGWALSPDDRRLAIGLSTGTGDDVWVKQLPSGPASTRISFDTAAEFRPRWTPDGRSVMFSSLRDGPTNANVYRRAANGAGADTLVYDYRLSVFEVGWTPDQSWLVFRHGGIVNQTGARDILAIRPGVDSAPVPMMASTEFDEAAIALSPDGRWIAYESNESGRREVYVRPFPGVDAAKRQVSTTGGTAPLWSRDGRELFFVTGDRRMASRLVRTTPDLELGEETVLFRLSEGIYLTSIENYTPHDVTRDGRFVMARRRQQPGVEQPLIVAE